MYQAINVSHRIGKRSILQGINLEIKPGQFTAILGPNGAGKSTLLKIISGEIRPVKGEVLLHRKSIYTMATRELSLHRAVLPQHAYLTFPFTVLEIVLLGRLPHQNTEAENAPLVYQIMQQTDVWHLKDRIYTSLSGGEKQRVQLARVMAQIHSEKLHTRYLLLDEPTSSLDMSCQHLILGRAKALCAQNIGVLAILHDLNLAAQYADRLLFLRDGETLAYGPVEKVLTEEIVEETFVYPVKIIHDPDTAKPVVYSTPTIHPLTKTSFNGPAVRITND